MKICPQCRTSYTDDSLQFCLQDGTPLAASFSTSSDLGEQETVISGSSGDSQREKMRVDIQNRQPSSAATGERYEAEPAPRKSNTGLIVVLTALVTLFGVAALIFGVLYFNRSKKTEVVQNTNNKPVNAVVPNAAKTTPANANSANANASPTATPTPAPTLNPKEIDKIASDVKNVIEDWKDATENLDLDSNLGNYAETVNYYNAGKVTADRVRADKQKAFEAYHSIDLNISNMKITPDSKGENVTAVFDKEWTFEGDQKYSAGKVQQQLELSRIGGKWRITGEKDIKVYYVNN